MKLIQENQSLDTPLNVEKMHEIFSQNYIHEHEWAIIIHQFDLLNDGLIKKIIETYDGISKTDIRLFILIQMGYSTKGISNVRNITIAGVKKGRQRLLKKMNLSRFSAFNRFEHLNQSA